MKPMKKYLYILLAVAALLAVACQEEKITYEIHDNITVVSQNLIFQPQGGSGEVVVEAESPVSASADRPWCNVTANGMTITVTVPEWTGKESRYATITIKSGQETISLTAQQFGEVIGGLDMTDVTSPAEGSVKEFKYVSNLPVSMVANESWIHIAIDEELQVVKITIDKNTEAGTRAGVVNYTIGGHSGTFNVLQYPETILVQDGWTATVVDGGYEHPKQFDVISMQATNPAEKFVWAIVNKSKVTDVADYAFSVVAVEKKNEIMAKVESGQIASFAEGLSSGSLTEKIYDLDFTSDAYAIFVGYGDNGYVTGRWGYVDLSIDDRQPKYYKWIGSWNVPRGSEVDTWVIEAGENEKTVKVSGFGGMDATTFASGALVAVVDYDAETGELVFKVYENTAVTWNNSTYGKMNGLLSGQYTNVAGKTYYSSGVGTVICRATMSEDYKTATITPGTVTSGGAPATFHCIRWYGRYTKADGSRSGVSWTGTDTAIPATMTKVTE